MEQTDSPDFPDAHPGYVLMKDGAHVGPFTIDELAAKVAAGELSPSDKVQREGTPIWQPLRVVLASAEVEPAGDKAPVQLAGWPDLAKAAAARLRHDVESPTAATAAGLLGVGAVTLLLSWAPFLFWLPWVALALIAGISLCRTPRKVVGAVVAIVAVLLPFLLTPSADKKPVIVVAASDNSAAPPAVKPLPPGPVAPVFTTDPLPLPTPPPLAASASATPAPIPAAQPALVTEEPTAPAPVPASSVAAATPVPAPAVVTTAEPETSPAPVVEAPGILSRVGGFFKAAYQKLFPPPAPIVMEEPATPAPKATPRPDFVQAHAGTLAIVRDQNFAGSGFVAEMDGKTYLFTNAHVLAGMTQPRFTLLNGRAVTPSSVELAVDHDVIRFSLKEELSDRLVIRNTVEANVKIRDAVSVYGNQGGAGVVTRLPGYLEGIGPDRVEVTCDFIPGNSGSPVIHEPSGEVIGVATYILRQYDDWTIPKRFLGFGSGGGDTDTGLITFRRFGYRVDSVRGWEPVNWVEFQNESKQVDQVAGLTADIVNFFDSISRGNAPSFTTETLRRPANDWLIKLRRPHLAEADRQSATQSFLYTLRNLSRADVSALDGRMRYGYFRDRLRKEREIRDRLYKAFDEGAQNLAIQMDHAIR